MDIILRIIKVSRVWEAFCVSSLSGGNMTEEKNLIICPYPEHDDCFARIDEGELCDALCNACFCDKDGHMLDCPFYKSRFKVMLEELGL